MSDATEYWLDVEVLLRDQRSQFIRPFDCRSTSPNAKASQLCAMLSRVGALYWEGVCIRTQRGFWFRLSDISGVLISVSEIKERRPE